MTDTPQNTPQNTPRDTPPDSTPGPPATGLSQSGDLSGISELFGLRGGQQAESGTRTSSDTVGRWVAATEAAAQPPDISGRLVHGRYRLIAELGVGGMGVTYRAWDTQAGIPVVIKMPRREVRSDSEAMQRFAREIAAMLAVPHEHIVPITDHGDDDGCPFVAMRFLPGGSLADYRRRDEAGNAIRNPPGMLHLWLPGVATALDHIHSKGMLHRDVKPGNIFLDGFLKPYLGDFGIAKVLDESGGLQKEQTITATKTAVGTPEYMAPELFKPRSKPDGRADQYSLAVTVYEMLAGEKPFKGERAHIIVEHSALAVPPLSAKMPGLPQRLCMAVEKGLAKKPEERFATCRDFAAAVVAELVMLEPELDTVRLLCPSCKNILKLPQKAAGKTGKCPRCQAAMDVADDLGSLWLESEERGGDTGRVGAVTPTVSPLLEVKVDQPRRRWGMKEWGAIAIAACCGLAVGYPYGVSVNAAKSEPEIQEVRQTAELLAARNAELETDSKRLQEAAESLKAENKRFSEALAIMRAEKQPAPIGTPPVILDTPRMTNSIGADFRLLPAGTFTMGHAASGPIEQAHRVTLTQPFYLGVHEVTNAQWKQVMGSVPSKWKEDAHPVEQVSWEEAVEFCRKLSALPEERNAGRVYRLPTEAEWEYACRSGTTTKYAFGDDEKLLGDYGWFGDNSGKQTHPVGLKKPSAWGLYDMHGNVWEWCSDWNGIYPDGEVTNPEGPSSGSVRVIRGGRWSGPARDCRSAFRFEVPPSYRYEDLGFRLALSRSGAKPPEAGTDQGTKIAPPEGSTPAAGNASVSIPASATAVLNLPETITSTVGIKLTLIPAGTFTMGEAGSSNDSDEKPHRVTLTKPFYMGVHEVTHAQWKRVIGSVPSKWKDEDLPVEQVSLDDAVEFCRKLSALPAERKAGRVYRLPTEAEWEYACRAGTTTKFSFGDDEKLFGDYGWFGGNSVKQTHPVGQKKPNAWGLHDMHGNVLEWCSDWYETYADGEVTNPQGPSSGSLRVYRGGSWNSTARHCRSAYRFRDSPSLRYNLLGFRLALSPSGAESPGAGK
jgi:formylglycine-generating enzyme required for sulfatase activity/serine/threonine protein kinase